MTGLSPELAARFGLCNRQGGQLFQLADDLDAVMLRIEETLLQEHRADQSEDASLRLAAETAALLQEYGTRVDLAAGEELLTQGTRSDHPVFLRAGQLRATVTDRNEESHIVSRFLPGAIVGEIAHYAGVGRTATLSAETASTVICIDSAALALMERNDATAAAHFHRNLASVLAKRLLMTTRLLSDAEL